MSVVLDSVSGIASFVVCLDGPCKYGTVEHTMNYGFEGSAGHLRREVDIPISWEVFPLVPWLMTMFSIRSLY
jgi:hypothetical protein